MSVSTLTLTFACRAMKPMVLRTVGRLKRMIEKQYTITPETQIFIKGVKVPEDREDLEEQFKAISGEVILNEVAE